MAIFKSIGKHSRKDTNDPDTFKEKKTIKQT